jgi:hypothetical protein
MFIQPPNGGVTSLRPFVVGMVMLLVFFTMQARSSCGFSRN